MNFLQKSFSFFLPLCFLVCQSVLVFAQKEISLESNSLRLKWTRSASSWKITTLAVKKGVKWVSSEKPSGESTILYSLDKPSLTTAQSFKTNTGDDFPEVSYHKQLKKKWDETISPVALNTAGKAYHFYPDKAVKIGKSIVFTTILDIGTLTTSWSFDPKFPTDVLISQKLKAKSEGFFSISSPTIATISEKNLSRVTVPGYFQGNKVNKDFVTAYGYGQGIPELPVIYRERCTSTLCPMITNNEGITFSVIPDPGLSRDPWETDHITQRNWYLGLSHKNRKSEFTPTIYYPVLGEDKSSIKPGQEISYNFRYSISDKDWFKTLNHAVYDVYKFGETLALRKNKESLTLRMEKILNYVTKPATSLWKVDKFENRQIGAQAYLGAVVGSEKDAIKNSDYGAMWMLSSFTADTALTMGRLPYALNFKLAQQQTSDGFFKGAVRGQYYLYKSDKWVEEWGSIVEPIGLTYYVLSDMANILLYEPDNTELKQRIKMGADLLLKWQRKDGSWAVAYDHKTEREVYKDIKDLRPTFYGMIIAYQVTKDGKYLVAAEKGARWYIENAVTTGSFLGVCGDMRYMADFATAQSSQALLELYDVTGKREYRDAAITVAKIYTTSIYTHPVASQKIKNVNGVERQDWEISQSGLSFEHGGILGSANGSGPIQLCSHAGLFIRMFQYTKEPIFKDMARAAAHWKGCIRRPKNKCSFILLGSHEQRSRPISSPRMVANRLDNGLFISRSTNAI